MANITAPSATPSPTNPTATPAGSSDKPEQPKNYGMTLGDMINLLNTDPRNKTSNRTEVDLKLKYPLYNLFIEFPTVTNTLYNKLTFPAYINGAISDSYNPSFSDSGPVFGRMDSIPVYSKTTRTIKVGFYMPANDINDAREIRKKLDILVKNTYPTYELSNDSTKRLTIKRPPLIRIKFGNIICNPLNEGSGLLGYLAGGINVDHDLSSGIFTEWPGQEIYAKKYSIQLSMNVLHEFTPGFVERNEDQKGPLPEAVFVWPGTRAINPEKPSPLLVRGGSLDRDIANAKIFEGK